MNHARSALVWPAIVGLVTLAIRATSAAPEAPEPPSRCPADCRIRLARGRPVICARYGIDVLSAPICGVHDRPAR